MHRINWFALGVTLAFALPIVNAVYKWKLGKPLTNTNIVVWISVCIFLLSPVLAGGVLWGELLTFTIMAAISGVYFLLIHPKLFGRREQSQPPDE
jgi:hypothetical protein